MVFFYLISNYSLRNLFDELNDILCRKLHFHSSFFSKDSLSLACYPTSVNVAVLTNNDMRFSIFF